MAYFFKVLFSCILLLALSTMSAAASRGGVVGPRPRVQHIATRLQAEGMIKCWDSLIELRSCTGEVILFFLNGETYLGPSCCRAIRVIEHSCWAADAMLAALGFTAQEGDVLREYCDVSGGPSAPESPSSIAPSPVA